MSEQVSENPANPQETPEPEGDAVREASWRQEPEKTFPLGILIVLKVHDIFGERAALILVWFISLWIWLFSPELRLSSRHYLRRISSFAAARGVRLGRLSTRKHVYAVSVNFFERMLSWKGSLTVDRLISEDNAHERMLARAALPEGAVIIGAHAGNSEMLRGMNSSCSQKKITSFMFAHQFPRLMELIKSLNSQSNLSIIMAEEITPATGMMLSEKLDAGEWIYIMGDRLLASDTRYCEVEFLGKKARFPLGPWLLAAIFKKPVYTVFAVKIHGKYHLYFQEVGEIRISRKNRNEALRKYVENYARFLEELLLKAPYQWFNFFDFWEEYSERAVNEKGGNEKAASAEAVSGDKAISDDKTASDNQG